MYYIQINFCQIETSKMDKVPHETKYTSVWCFSLNKLEDHPLLETLSQHISLTDLDCSRGFVRCFPYVFSVQFPRDLGHAFSQHWPAVLQGLLFSDGRWKLCGDQDAQGRHFFWVLWIWNDFDHFKMLMIFPKKLRSWSIQDNALQVLGGLASVFVGHGNGWFMFHTYWITSKCFWYKWESSFILKVSTSSLTKLSLKSSDFRHCDGISKEEKDF